MDNVYIYIRKMFICKIQTNSFGSHTVKIGKFIFCDCHKIPGDDKIILKSSFTDHGYFKSVLLINLINVVVSFGPGDALCCLNFTPDTDRAASGEFRAGKM